MKTHSGAHHVHIALADLGLPFDEVTDYSKPRKPEYLKINPNRKVPTLTYGDHVIFESAIIAQFLADSVASMHLTPRTEEAQGPFMRERISFFIKTYFSKANVYYCRTIEAKTDDDTEELGTRYFDDVVKKLYGSIPTTHLISTPSSPEFEEGLVGQQSSVKAEKLKSEEESNKT
ncbi:hypothetical protein N7495_007034 [Penicillium taxi]|uniref:uncharacterized protein n=1 Tax=Penicillium taxi TaxID=168475 RepID=UPI0025455C02|nr:uncharacterized protein N7495_007034 [Penicillium taxi]KAJ5895343.1 hypothetical protein N7495_007034 [Penicillium taxi]